MTAHRVSLPSHTVPSHTDPRWAPLDVDLRAAVCSDAPLLISGDRDATRLVARVVHDHNPRQRAARFVSVSHETLAETFATVPVSAHGGLTAMVGLDDIKEGATFFIDEVDRLTPGAQDMLMYFLDVVYGSPASAPRALTNTRVIAATTQDLVSRAANGSFRSDLLYRLNVIHLSMPTVWKAGERQLHSFLATLSG